VSRPESGETDSEPPENDISFLPEVVVVAPVGLAVQRIHERLEIVGRDAAELGNDLRGHGVELLDLDVVRRVPVRRRRRPDNLRLRLLEADQLQSRPETLLPVRVRVEHMKGTIPIGFSASTQPRDANVGKDICISFTPLRRQHR